MKLFRLLGLAVITALILGIIGSSVLPQTYVRANGDADELPIYIEVVGNVKAFSSTVIVVDDLTFTFPANVKIPPTLIVGSIVTVRADLREDDTLIVITIIIGVATPTSTQIGTPSPVVIVTATPLSNPPSATPAGTAPATVVVPVIQGCGLPKAVLALYIAKAYGISLDELEYWHCKGNAYGVIARAYIIVFGTEGAKTTVEKVLIEYGKGKKWVVIIIEVGAHIDTDSIIVTVQKGEVKPGKCPPGHAKKGECEGTKPGKGGGKKK